MYILGVLVCIGTALAFAAIGVLTLWGGLTTMRTELARDYLRTQASGGPQFVTLLLVGLPLLIAAVFSLFSALRFLQKAFGLG